MPSRSEKEELTDLLTILTTNQVMELQIFGKDEGLQEEDYLSLLVLMDLYRYLEDRTPVPKSKHWINFVLCNHQFNDTRFRAQLRLEKQAFHDLLGLLGGDPSFTANQEPVALQIAVGLYRLGNCGNSSSIGNVSTKFGIAEGTVEDFTNRLIQALINICNNWIVWPSEEERLKISRQMAQELLPNCIGFIDGSDAHFYQAPKDDKEVYWSRKKRYCMQFQVICDPNRNIRSFLTGFPGSVHDAKVFTSSDVYLNAGKYFGHHEYIVGDSAYPKTDNTVVPYRRTHGQLEKKQAIFNKHIASKRVTVEHTIGILKGRFKSLTGLRINVNRTNGHQSACQWIQACCVLHNILNKRDPWTKELDDLSKEEDFNVEPEERCQVVDGNSAEHRRTCLVEMINAMYKNPIH